MNATKQEVSGIACPIRGHAHPLVLFTDGSLRCTLRDGYRWIRAAAVDARNAEMPVPTLTRWAETDSFPPAIRRALKPERWNGETWFRRTRPHWGWPADWTP